MGIDISTETVQQERKIQERTYSLKIDTNYLLGKDKYKVTIDREVITLLDGNLSTRELTISDAPIVSISQSGDATDPSTYSYDVVQEARCSKVEITSGDIAAINESITTQNGTVVPLSELAEVIELANERIVLMAKEALAQSAANREIERQVNQALREQRRAEQESAKAAREAAAAAAAAAE